MSKVVLFWVCHCLLFIGSLACSSSNVHDEYRVVRKTDAGGKQLVVATEENAQLFCQTNVPWKKCWWKPPRNGVRQVCNYLFTKSTLRYCATFSIKLTQPKENQMYIYVIFSKKFLDYIECWEAEASKNLFSRTTFRRGQKVNCTKTCFRLLWKIIHSNRKMITSADGSASGNFCVIARSQISIKSLICRSKTAKCNLKSQYSRIVSNTWLNFPLENSENNHKGYSKMVKMFAKLAKIYL